jgi:hypothetical protein
MRYIEFLLKSSDLVLDVIIDQFDYATFLNLFLLLHFVFLLSNDYAPLVRLACLFNLKPKLPNNMLDLCDLDAQYVLLGDLRSVLDREVHVFSVYLSNDRTFVFHCLGQLPLQSHVLVLQVLGLF